MVSPHAREHEDSAWAARDLASNNASAPMPCRRGSTDGDPAHPTPTWLGNMSSHAHAQRQPRLWIAVFLSMRGGVRGVSDSASWVMTSGAMDKMMFSDLS